MYGHDINSCPYYIFDDGFAKLSNMIKTMNEQQVEFANKIREYDLSHETDLKFSPPILDVYSCDDGASFPPLESRLEIVCDPPLTTPSLIAPSSSSTLRDNNTFIITILDPPLPLPQLKEFETFSINASVDEITLVMSQTIFLLRCMILM